MAADVIAPRTLKGFHDSLPARERLRARLVATARRTFESFGFDAFDTPALEYSEILRGKGSDESDKQMFEFDDQGGRRVALRFDLTVPLARFVAQHQHELPIPFRGYHVGTVWRGERPKRGRFREFLQCDADIVGVADDLADAEIVTLFALVLDRLDVGDFRLHVNDRRVLNGIIDLLGLHDHVVPVLRTLDKRDKIGLAAVEEELRGIGLTGADARTLLDLITATRDDDEDTLAELAKLVGSHPEGARGIDLLRRLSTSLAEAGVDPRRVKVDPATVRGLDYYTGVVFETTFLPVPDIGSICSGGRYDDLTGTYTRTKLPGVGGSIGIDRIIAALDETGGLAAEPRPGTLVVVTRPADADVTFANELAMALRDRGVAVDVYPAERPHSTQMKYAGNRGARLAVTVEPDQLHVRDLEARESTLLPRDGAVDAVLALLGG